MLYKTKQSKKTLKLDNRITYNKIRAGDIKTIYLTLTWIKYQKRKLKAHLYSCYFTHLKYAVIKSGGPPWGRSSTIGAVPIESCLDEARRIKMWF